MHQKATRNQTGIAAAPERSREMLEGMEEFPPSSEGSAKEIAQVRISYAKDAAPLGSVPMAGVEAVQGRHPALFIDKLGERLAFERAGIRCYEALLSKHEAYGTFKGGPSRADLQQIHAQECEHFKMVHDAIVELGGDPTAITPSADLSTTMGHGISTVIVDPRTTLLQSLEAILVAELADNASWEALVELAEKASEEQLVAQFKRAHSTEQQHLAKVRAWIAAGQGRSAD